MCITIVRARSCKVINDIKIWQHALWSVYETTIIRFRLSLNVRSDHQTLTGLDPTGAADDLWTREMVIDHYDKQGLLAATS